ncbi:uncharacterized protein METZ01_LOCUS238716, partial [marine metagenome]
IFKKCGFEYVNVSAITLSLIYGE